jgi:hypothetical protein
VTAVIDTTPDFESFPGHLNCGRLSFSANLLSCYACRCQQIHIQSHLPHIPDTSNIRAIWSSPAVDRLDHISPLQLLL